MPAIVETDLETGETFCLSESTAILRYLADSRGLPDHWYPSDVKQRALVDHYFDWHHNFLRQGAGFLVFRKLFAPRMLGITYSEEDFKFQEVYLRRSLVMMERWLTANKYLCGPEPSIADLSACTELDQTKMLNYDLSKYPKVEAWLHKMIDEEPKIAKMSAPFRKMAQMSLKKQAKL